MNKYKRLLSNTAILGMGTFASKVLVFLLMPLYTAILSAEEFGLADLVAQTANLLIPLAAVGICDGLFRFTLDTDEADRKKVFTASMTVLSIGSAVLALIAFGVYCLGQSGAEFLPMIVAYVVCANFHSAVAHYLRAKGHTTLFAAQGVANTVLTIVLNIFFLVVWKMGSMGYVLSVVVADLLITLGLMFIGRVWRDFSFRAWDGKVAKALLKFSLPYIPTTMMWLVTSVADRYIVTIYCGTAIHGLYTAASKIPTLVLLVSGVFIEAWHVSSVKENPEERSSFFGTVYRNYMGLMFIGASVLIACSKIFTRLLLADSYYSSWEYVPILVVAMVFAAFSSFFGSVYFLEKKSMLSMVTAMAGAIINVILNFLLIPKHGAIGAAVATLISYIMTYTIRSLDTVRYVRFSQYYVRVAINTVLLLAQAGIMIAAPKYWQYAQLFIVLAVLVINGRGMLQMARQIFSKKSKKN